MSLGVAILTRNNAATIEQAITPWLDVADEIAVVIGGISNDRTAEIADGLGATVAQAHHIVDAKFLAQAQLKLSDPTIPDKYGHLLGALADFGAARQLSFDLLDTDWVVVVDTDDVWAGIDEIPWLAKLADDNDQSMIRVEYGIDSSIIYQPRIFKREAGQWSGIIHEKFVLADDTTHGITSDCAVRQAEKSGKKRLDQNILLGRLAVHHDPDNRRAMFCLAQDYLAHSGDMDSALPLLDKCIELWGGEYDDVYLSTLHLKGVISLHRQDYETAVLTALRSLGASANGAAWSILAESAMRLSNGSGSHGLFELAAMACDKALTSGKPRYGFGINQETYTTLPSIIKGLALSAMDRPQEALNAVDLGLAINPAHEELLKLQGKLCGVLNKAP